MELSIENIGKKYNKHWLFKNVNFKLQSGESLAVLGKNGSGKSTLLQIVFGLIQPSEGLIRLNDKQDFEANKHFALSAPYLELPMEFTTRELHQLKLSLGKIDLDLDAFVDFANFTNKQADLPLKHFSSGMLQRLKTAFCLISNSEILLLDEPLTNMDASGEKWYLNQVDKLRNKICIVASNQTAEYAWTQKSLSL